MCVDADQTSMLYLKTCLEEYLKAFTTIAGIFTDAYIVGRSPDHKAWHAFPKEY